MTHALDFHNSRVAEKLIHHAIVANANSVRTLRTRQLLGAMRQRLVSELRASAMIRETASRGIRRRSFLVDFRHCRLKEAIALELGNELLVRDGGLAAALGYDGQIFQIFEQFLVIGNRKNDGSAFAVVVRDVLNRIAHAGRLAETHVLRN